jgi:hypothetical protein
VFIADLHFNVGDVFDGHVITDTCTKRQPDVISFEIKSIRRDTYFSTVAFVSYRSLAYMTAFHALYEMKDYK